jgi:hypothetical protein
VEGEDQRDEDLEVYLEVLDRAFGLPRDQLMFYYSAHEMFVAREERFTAATGAEVARLPHAWRPVELRRPE